MNRSLPLFSLAALTWLNCSPSANAQGPLTPPGPPGAVYKTLDQLAPGIDVQTLPGDASALHVISAPGAYILTANASGASGVATIAIASSGVTLDLRGFTVMGTASSNGIEIRAGAFDAVVCNGKVRGSGLAGIDIAASLSGVVLEGLTISDGGTAVRSFSPATVRNCDAARLNGNGFLLLGFGSVLDCYVESCTGSAVFAISASVVSRCRVAGIVATTAAVGISGDEVQGCSVKNIIASSGYATGINANATSDCSVGGVNAASGSAALGITGSTVSRCRVTDVGKQSAGTPTGIVAASVTGCSVMAVGGNSTGGAVRGIEGAAISQCSVSGLGATTLAQPVTGILAGGSFGTGTASDCSVDGIAAGAAPVRGILGTDVRRCKVSNVNQAVASAITTNAAAGIEAEGIAECHVSAVSGANSGAGTPGLLNFRLAQGCVVNGVTDSSTTGNGMFTTLPAVIDRCTIAGCKVGVVLYGAASQVRHCTITNPTGAGNPYATINVPAAGCRVEGCTISGGSIGISFGSAGGVVDGNTFASMSVSVAPPPAGTVVVTRNRFGTGIFPLSSSNVLAGPVLSGSGTINSTSPWANFSE